MAAPALVLLAHGSSNPLVAEISHAMRVAMQEMRPEISVHTAFLNNCSPSAAQVVARIARSQNREVVFVPLNLSASFGTDPEVTALVDRVRASHPGLSFAVSRPIGPEACLLSVLDQQLRTALSSAHVSELDGLVLLAEGASDQRSQSLLARRARQWSVHHKLPVVTATAAAGAPGTLTAINTLRSQGRRHIAVGSLFLAPDEVWEAQAEQARRAGAVTVSEPLGVGPELLEVAWGRYAVAAMGLIDFGLDEEPTEDSPVRHLHVVSA